MPLQAEPGRQWIARIPSAPQMNLSGASSPHRARQQASESKPPALRTDLTPAFSPRRARQQVSQAGPPTLWTDLAQTLSRRPARRQASRVEPLAPWPNPVRNSPLHEKRSYLKRLSDSLRLASHFSTVPKRTWLLRARQLSRGRALAAGQRTLFLPERRIPNHQERHLEKAWMGRAG